MRGQTTMPQSRDQEAQDNHVNADHQAGRAAAGSIQAASKRRAVGTAADIFEVSGAGLMIMAVVVTRRRMRVDSGCIGS